MFCVVLGRFGFHHRRVNVNFCLLLLSRKGSIYFSTLRLKKKYLKPSYMNVVENGDGTCSKKRFTVYFMSEYQEDEGIQKQ